MNPFNDCQNDISRKPRRIIEDIEVIRPSVCKQKYLTSTPEPYISKKQDKENKTETYSVHYATKNTTQMINIHDEFHAMEDMDNYTISGESSKEYIQNIKKKNKSAKKNCKKA